MIFPMQKIMKCTIKRFSRLSLKIRTKKGERKIFFNRFARLKKKAYGAQVHLL